MDVRMPKLNGIDAIVAIREEFPKARIIVYQGPNNNADAPGTGPYDTLAAMVSQDKVQVLSNSWGECETLESLVREHAVARR